MTANERHFTICHNDDSPSDPEHRRVPLRMYKQNGRWWLTFPETENAEHIDMGANLREAEYALDHVYPAGGAWDRRPA